MNEALHKPQLRSLMLKTALYTALATVVCFIKFRDSTLTPRLFREHDLPVLILTVVLLAGVALWPRPYPALRLPQGGRRFAFATALAVLLLAWAGNWLVFGGYALTRDEILADFDSIFLAQGHLISPVLSEWQPFAHALMPQFMLPLPEPSHWLSGYLPINAALRAAGEASIGSSWVNPALAAFSGLVLYRIACRLWPQAPENRVVALILLLSSAQFLTMAMTAYAMPAHLALNLLWLACFLRGDRKGDAAALVVGFLATGLHQILFHPLFVLPFLVDMWFSNQRRRALLYAVGYAVIGLFWASYWQIILAAAGVGGEDTASAAGISYLFSRLLELFGSVRASAVALMTLNLLRFISWQNLVLLPLAFLAWPAIRRGDGIARPLAGGITLTLVVMLVLLPWQGHGWGYRYLHGCIGSAALLGAYGWQSLTEGTERRLGLTALTAATVASVLLVVPLHLKQAYAFIAPYRAAYAMIERSPADVVLVDGAGLLFAEDLVRNRPDLANRPKIMAILALNEREVRALCARYKVALFGQREGLAAGISRVDVSEGADWSIVRRKLLAELRCTTPLTADAEGGAAR